MGTTIKCGLSAQSLLKAADEVRKYRASLEDKCREFREQLVKVGIDSAKANCGAYAGMIMFYQQDVSSNMTMLIAVDNAKIVRTWYASKRDALAGKNPRSYSVSPLLLSEFGSGWLSKVLFDIDGVGQGTMPGQTHAFDANGWFWYDEDGVKQHSEGEAPTHPMYAASMAMLVEIENVARKVFGTNEVIQC